MKVHFKSLVFLIVFSQAMGDLDDSLFLSKLDNMKKVSFFKNEYYKIPRLLFQNEFSKIINYRVRLLLQLDLKQKKLNKKNSMILLKSSEKQQSFQSINLNSSRMIA